MGQKIEKKSRKFSSGFFKGICEISKSYSFPIKVTHCNLNWIV